MNQYNFMNAADAVFKTGISGTGQSVIFAADMHISTLFPMNSGILAVSFMQGAAC